MFAQDLIRFLFEPDLSTNAVEKRAPGVLVRQLQVQSAEEQGGNRKDRHVVHGHHEQVGNKPSCVIKNNIKSARHLQILETALYWYYAWKTLTSVCR